MAIKGFTWKNV